MSSAAAQAIITKGLTCGRSTACESGTSITAGSFSLYCLTPMPIQTPTGGGSRPMQPGEISQLYQVVPEQYYVVNRNQEAEYFRTRIPVTIKLTMGKFKVDKEYLVPEERARVIVNIANVYNVTKDRMAVTFSNVRRTYTKALVKLSNFRVRR